LAAPMPMEESRRWLVEGPGGARWAAAGHTDPGGTLPTRPSAWFEGWHPGAGPGRRARPPPTNRTEPGRQPPRGRGGSGHGLAPYRRPTNVAGGFDGDHRTGGGRAVSKWRDMARGGPVLRGRRGTRSIEGRPGGGFERRRFSGGTPPVTATRGHGRGPRGAGGTHRRVPPDDWPGRTTAPRLVTGEGSTRPRVPALRCGW